MKEIREKSKRIPLPLPTSAPVRPLPCAGGGVASETRPAARTGDRAASQTTPQAASHPDPFAVLMEWQRRHDAALRRLAELEGEVAAALAVAVGERTAEFAALRRESADLESRLVTLAAAHPEWREGQSVKSPLGRIEFRSVTRLAPVNAAASILLVETLVGPGSARETLRGWRPEQFLAVEKRLRLEALEALDDADLRALGIRRTRTETASVKPARPSLTPAPAPANQTHDALPQP